VDQWFQAVILGVLQGLTEFLPISSNAHLRIFGDLAGWGDPGAAFTAVVQIGTELAVLLYFRQDIWNIVSTWTRSVFDARLRGDLNARMGWYVIVGSLPIVVLGVIFQHEIETAARNLWLIATMLVVMGLVLGITDRLGWHAKPIKSLGFRDAVLYGVAQAGALIPGVSRSGATISMGLALGYERAAAARYAFLLAIPSVLGAGIFELRDAFGEQGTYGTGPILAATLAAFSVGYASIAWLLRYVSTHSYLPFVVYRIALGFLVYGLLLTGVLDS
jgi:undecaprenyl-diphosphatase